MKCTRQLLKHTHLHALVCKACCRLIPLQHAPECLQQQSERELIKSYNCQNLSVSALSYTRLIPLLIGLWEQWFLVQEQSNFFLLHNYLQVNNQFIGLPCKQDQTLLRWCGKALMLLSTWTLATDLSAIPSTEEAGFSRLQQCTFALLGRTGGASPLARMRMICAWRYLHESVKNVQENEKIYLGIKEPLVRLLSDFSSSAVSFTPQ